MNKNKRHNLLKKTNKNKFSVHIGKLSWKDLEKLKILHKYFAAHIS